MFLLLVAASSALLMLRSCTVFRFQKSPLVQELKVVDAGQQQEQNGSDAELQIQPPNEELQLVVLLRGH